MIHKNRYTFHSNCEVVGFNYVKIRLTVLVYGGRGVGDHKINILYDGYDPL